MSDVPDFISNPFKGDLRHVNALIYGHSGSGKTYLAATAPKPLILDFERGAMLTVQATGNEDARVVVVDSMKTLKEVYAWLKTAEHEFETVVLDPLGDVQKLIMEEAFKKYQNSRRAFGKVPTMQDWGLFTDDFSVLMNGFYRLPLNTIVLAHVANKSDEEDVISPLLQGTQMKSFAVRIPDLVGYLAVSMKGETTVRTLQTQSTKTVLAKARGGKLPRVIENPNMAEIIRTMKGETK